MERSNFMERFELHWSARTHGSGLGTRSEISRSEFGEGSETLNAL